VVITILVFIAMLVVIILAHELGHFGAAKIAGVRVDEFGIGFPPRLFSIKRGDTIYSINAFPIGGFVKVAGEEDPSAPGGLASKSIPARLLFLSAGSIMNLLLPFLLLSIAFMVPHQEIIGQVVVEEVAPNSPAAEAGIIPGDVFLSVNGKPVNNTSDISRYFYTYLGSKFTAEIQHSDATIEEVELTARWKPPEDEGAVGVAITTQDASIVTQRYSWKAIPMGASRCFEILVLFKNGIISMIIGEIPLEFTGPVGIAQLTGEVAKGGISPTLELAAFISINLGIINIFPLPALDGGRIIFVLLEWVRRGKRVSVKTERLIHSIGFILLIGAILAITYKDILRLVTGGSLMP
jgi:regulator of sigma E protease